MREHALETRTLPGTDIRVSSLGLGCARIGGVFSGQSRADDLSLLREAFDAGVRLFDTADIYGQGESERLLGEAFARCRQDVVIVSKVGFQLPRSKSIAQRVKPFLRPMARRVGLAGKRLPGVPSVSLGNQQFDPASIVSAAEASLRRLKTDYLDVLLLHSPPPRVIAEGVYASAAECLRRSGRIRAFGISCEHPEDAMLALKQGTVSCVEVPLSLLHREAIETVLPAATAAGKGVMGRQSLASGLLAWSLDDPRLSAQTPEHLADLRRCHALAAELGLPVPALALAFAVATRGVTTTLLGGHTTAQLKENLAWAAVPLSKEAHGRLAPAR